MPVLLYLAFAGKMLFSKTAFRRRVNCLSFQIFQRLGYRFGKDAVGKILQGGLMDKMVNAAGIVGCSVMGALTASYVSLTTKLSFGTGDAVISLQTDLFDAIMPKLLPLGVVMLCYWLFKKNLSPVKVMLVMMAVVAVLAIVGIV